ncbi:MAG: hypothetical protein KBS59_06450 [Clostridiales bacterium]|nr:hypothetical protein [Clostridiales bacterium]
MAEGFNEWGDYSSEEQWQSRSKIRKIFSFRTLGKAIKILLIAIAVGVYGILAYRLLTGLGVPADMKKLMYSQKLAQSETPKDELVVYLKDELVVYLQEPEANFGSDGRFSIYSVKYIPSLDELQFTVRYNRSTVAALKEDIEAKYAPGDDATDAEIAELSALKQAALESIDDNPFVFVLRDNFGKVYTDYAYSSYVKGLYTYVRFSFDGVALFCTETASVKKDYFTPDGEYSDIIYKGQNKSELVSEDISYLYIDFYGANDVQYESESWADPLLVYRSGLDISRYEISKSEPLESENIFYFRTK